MAKSKLDADIAKRVENAVKPIVEGLGFEIVDVEYKKIRDDMNLTIFMDIPRGVTLDDCELVHNTIDPIIDELDPTDGKPYILNVSSAGLDRPFNKQRDYERNYGKEVEIKLYAPIKGKKFIEGVLKEKTENTVTVITDSGEMKIECNKIVFTRPLVKFE